MNSHVSYVVCWFGFRMLSPVFDVPTPIICPTPSELPTGLVKVDDPVAEVPAVDPAGVDPPIVAPVNPADSAEPPLTVDEGVPPSPELLRFDAEPRLDPAPLVFNPPSG